MRPSPSPTFGKRNRPNVAPRATPVPAPAVATNDHAVFFAAVRRQVELPDTRPKVVPRSFRAALLAGLVIAFSLAGLDVTRVAAFDPVLDPLIKMTGFKGDTAQALPYMVALSLLSGARIAATTLLIAHRVLVWVGQSSYLAYAGAAAAWTALWAGVIFVTLGQPPQHGWIIDLAAGAGAGFLYRMFAGAKRLPDPARPRSLA